MSKNAGVTLRVLIALCVTTLVIAACGAKSGNPSSRPATGSSPTASVPPTATAQPKSITIENFSYMVPMAVPHGAQITVINKDSTAHTVTADSAGGFDTEVPPNSQATFTAPKEPGPYPFHCTYHPTMHGQLAVVQQE